MTMTALERPLTVAIAADHAGYEAKRVIVEHLARSGARVLDLGTDSDASVDYPDYARAVSRAVLGGKAALGILVCGTGIGMSIGANRHRGIRAALCHDHFTASAARRHNDANVLCVGGRTTGPAVVLEIVDTFLATAFDGGRHQRRVEALDQGGKTA
jgi:ribose 5-phosphate isomerase B